MFLLFQNGIANVSHGVPYQNFYHKKFRITVVYVQYKIYRAVKKAVEYVHSNAKKRCRCKSVLEFVYEKLDYCFQYLNVFAVSSTIWSLTTLASQRLTNALKYDINIHNKLLMHKQHPSPPERCELILLITQSVSDILKHSKHTKHCLLSYTRRNQYLINSDLFVDSIQIE